MESAGEDETPLHPNSPFNGFRDFAINSNVDSSRPND
jgi:hypothetical protein